MKVPRAKFVVISGGEIVKLQYGPVVQLKVVAEQYARAHKAVVVRDADGDFVVDLDQQSLGLEAKKK